MYTDHRDSIIPKMVEFVCICCKWRTAGHEVVPPCLLGIDHVTGTILVVAPRHGLEMPAHVSQRAEGECDPAWSNIAT